MQTARMLLILVFCWAHSLAFASKDCGYAMQHWKTAALAIVINLGDAT